MLYSLSNYGSDANFGNPDQFQLIGLSPSGAGTIKILPVQSVWYGPRIDNNEGLALEPNPFNTGSPTRNLYLTTDGGGDSNSRAQKNAGPCQPS